MPIRFSIVGIAVCTPRIDFVREHGGVGDAAGEALAGENCEFSLGQIEPAAVLGRIVSFEPLDDAARLGWLEGFIERCRRVSIQVVLNQQDFLGQGGSECRRDRAGSLHRRQPCAVR